MTFKYIVSVPGRGQPVCIEADSWSGVSDSGARFFKGTEVVATLAATDLIAKADSLPDFPALSQFQPVGQMCLAELAEPVRGLDPVSPVSHVTHNCWGVPTFWPFLSGAALGLIAGIGSLLSYQQVW